MISAALEPWIVENLAAVARFFHVHPDTIRTWRRQGLPGHKGAWDLSAIVAWREGQRRATPEKIPGAVEGRFEAEARKTSAEADMREMRRDEMREELISVDTVARLYARHATHARALWSQTPDRLLGLLPLTATGEDKRRFRVEAQKVVEDVIDTFHVDFLAQADQAKEETEDDCEDTTDAGLEPRGVE